MKIKGIDLLRGILLFVWTKKTMKYKKKDIKERIPEAMIFSIMNCFYCFIIVFVIYQ